MELADRKKIEWIEFNLFKRYPHLIHGTFLRHGGISQGHFATLNVSLDTGDHPDSVKSNREAIARSLNLPRIVFAHQTHSSKIHVVTSKHPQTAPHADALITRETGIGLGITHADCQAALFFDPVQKVIAAAHAGWRGTVQNIYGHLIETLRRDLHCQPKDLRVVISPSLGPDHAEFKHYKEELPAAFWSFQVRPNYFDFWEISKQQLLASGIPEEQLEIAAICSYCHSQDYYSYRKEKETGRNATVIALKS